MSDLSNWSEREIEILRALHGHETARTIGERLGRSKRAVAVKASRLGLDMGWQRRREFQGRKRAQLAYK